MRLGEKKILKFYFNFSKFCLSVIETKDETVNLKLINKIRKLYRKSKKLMENIVRLIFMFMMF